MEPTPEQIGIEPSRPTAQAALMQAELEGPGLSQPQLSDQEIRARALECAVSIRRNIDPLADPEVAEQDFWVLAGKFEAYIRNGK